MSIREISFASANGRDTIKAWSYSPLGTPKGIVQLIHGYGEHSRRYLHMILKFIQAGYVVYADDHLGHGKTGYVLVCMERNGEEGEDQSHQGTADQGCKNRNEHCQNGSTFHSS